MAFDIKTLIPAFRTKVQTLIANCKKRGVEMVPYYGIRTPLEQAKLWRQSRNTAEINTAIANLKAGGATYLATVLTKAGPQSGAPVTNALPGYSWHQWGEALDCYWLVDGKAEWSTTRKGTNNLNGYKVYAEEAQKLGLTAGGLWTSFKDWPHVQLRAAASPSSAGLTMKQINDEMKNRFG